MVKKTDKQELEVKLQLLVNNLEIAEYSLQVAAKLEEDIEKLMNINCKHQIVKHVSTE